MNSYRNDYIKLKVSFNSNVELSKKSYNIFVMNFNFVSFHRYVNYTVNNIHIFTITVNAFKFNINIEC